MRTIIPLKQYEPLRDLHRFAEVGGQLRLELGAARIPEARTGAPAVPADGAMAGGADGAVAGGADGAVAGGADGAMPGGADGAVAGAGGDSGASPGAGAVLSAAQMRSVLNAVLEVRTGRRALSHVQGLVSAQLYAQLGLRPPVPSVRFTVQRVRACPVTPTTWEATATATTATRTYAVTARFDLTDAGWRCTFFDILRPGRSPRSGEHR
ncbi:MULTISPECIES: Rv3235 family protein [Amycolatopsis]|uniref:Uncharacterized protein n=1 Tax=Amycolatopsis dongchuanensis TaxID=1070866 RepID=A0ABP8VKG3_9PSEU